MPKTGTANRSAKGREATASRHESMKPTTMLNTSDESWAIQLGIYMTFWFMMSIEDSRIRRKIREFEWKTFSAITSWINWASPEMAEMTSKLVEEPTCVSKKPTSCLSTDFRYSILRSDVCLSAVLVQQIPSARYLIVESSWAREPTVSWSGVQLLRNKKVLIFFVLNFYYELSRF